MVAPKLTNPLSWLIWLVRVLGSATYRFYWDDCFSRASALAYTSLFSLVPLTAITVSMFSIFGVEESQVGSTLQQILEQVLPPMENNQLVELQGQLFFHLQKFSLNAAALNTVSIGVLVFTCIALLNTIESALNAIWRVTSNLSVFAKVISFWAVITLGPLLIAISLYWTAKVKAYTADNQIIDSGLFGFANIVVPIAVSWLACALLFFKMPAAKVRFRDAALGGFFAAILFELVKSMFAYYVSLTATYSKIYGVLASIPLFLFWLYIAWVVVLLGAEIAYQAGSIRIQSGRKRYATALGEVGAVLGLQILLIIGKNFAEGEEPITEGKLASRIGSDPELLRSCLDLLSEANIITAADAETHARTLIKSPENLTVGDVLKTFLSPEERDAKDAEHQRAGFLEVLHHTASALDGSRAVESWTLKEMINAAQIAPDEWRV